MNEPPKDALRQFLEPLLEAQVDHPVYPRLEVLWDQPYDLGSLACRIGLREVRLSAAQVDEHLEGRTRLLADEQANPYRFGYEPAIWRETDWRLAELRAQFPGEPITLGVLGGNGSSKTWYMAKRFTMCAVENEDWLCWQFSEEEKTSRETPQRFIYRYLPPEYRSERGKLKKTAATKLTYNEANGFTDNTFSLPNRCRCNFMFYNGNIKALEGPRPDVVWADEMIPKAWAEAALRRLITKAGQARPLLPKVHQALAARMAALQLPAEQRQEALDLAWEQHLKPILPKLFQGVLAVSFTPAEGYSPTVAMLLDEARTLVEVEAEILPKTRGGEVVGYERVPRVMLNDAERAVVVFFHVYDNPFGGNWQAVKATLQRKGRDEKLWRAYGVATKTHGSQFPLFKREAHVRPVSWLPKVGTWYHVVDPCPGRNWFMCWFKACPVAGGKALKFFAREWPQPGDWIERGNIGDPGEWALPSASDRKFDGERGPAQRPWGLGFRQYAEEIERVEKELFQTEQRLAGAENWSAASGRIQIQDGCRIMDGRAGNAPTTTHGESLTLIEVMAEYELFFVSAGRDSGAEQGKTTIREGVSMICDALFYDEDNAELMPEGYFKFHGQAPQVIIADHCKNIIHALRHWTGRDGGDGACKDPVDVVRYGVIANPNHFESDENYNPGGGGY